ncbi:MAG: hypothetical protein U1E26_03630 [Coriobacteriia bacterium]|nr:hypothetical protein [Coriobacteriia bacterium]
MELPRFDFPEGVLARLAARDGSLFSDDPAVAAEATAYMGWTDLAAQASQTLPLVEALVADVKAEPLTDVVLLGMGGSSLATLVLSRLLPGDGTRMHVLDTTSPVTIAATLEAVDPATTLFILASKSGGTVEPNALYTIFRSHADGALGREAAGRRFIAITDPGSSLERLAADDGMRACVLAPPNVGGRYSALTVFGLVPAALIGVDVRRLISFAHAMEEGLQDGEPPQLAHLMASGHAAGRDKLTILAPEEFRVFGLWVEQLVAESLGKHGRGVVPLVVHQTSTLRSARADETLIAINASDPTVCLPDGDLPLLAFELADPHELGGWFVLWEYSVALVGCALRVNAFDQPNVAEAKAATNAMLDGSLQAPASQGGERGFELTFASRLEAPPQADHISVIGAVSQALDSLHPGDYLCVLAFLPDDQTALEPLLSATDSIGIARNVGTAFGLGPRYLHSTGQLHKGGPNTGVFIVVTSRDTRDAEIPGWPFTLGELHRAQAEGDLATLAAHGRRALRIDLPDADPTTVRALAELLERASRSHQGE